MDVNQRTMLYAQLSDNIQYTRMLVRDFLEADRESELQKRLPSATWSFTQNIVINLGKIFSRSPNETFRLERFEELGSQNINERIANLRERHRDLIAKVMVNRNKLFAHTDEQFHKVLFSQAEVTRMENKFGSKYPKLLAVSKQEERFTPTDIKNEIEAIEDILSELDAIWKEALTTDSLE